MAESDCIVFMGSNMAENHPVAFRWPMKAKLKGAKLIHVDPRFTRTSAVCDIYAPLRAGSDIAFLGGLIHFVLESKRFNEEPFFRQFLVNYTNAPMLVHEDFRDTEDLEGVFSGLLQYQGGVNEWPFNGFVGEYENKTWQYAGTQIEPQGWQGSSVQSGEQAVGNQPRQQGQGAEAGKDTARFPAGPPFDALVRGLLPPPPAT